MSKPLSRIAALVVAAALAGASARAELQFVFPDPVDDVLVQLDPELVAQLACLLDPGGCPDDDGDILLVREFEVAWSFLGVESVRMQGAGRAKAAAAWELEDVHAPLARLRDEDAAVYGGLAVPVGSSGRKESIHLGPAGLDALALRIAEGASALAGEPVAFGFTKPPKLVLRRSRGGDEAVLRIRGRGLADGRRVRFAATLHGVAIPAPMP